MPAQRVGRSVGRDVGYVAVGGSRGGGGVGVLGCWGTRSPHLVIGLPHVAPIAWGKASGAAAAASCRCHALPPPSRRRSHSALAGPAGELQLVVGLHPPIPRPVGVDERGECHRIKPPGPSLPPPMIGTHSRAAAVASAFSSCLLSAAPGLPGRPRLVLNAKKAIHQTPRQSSFARSIDCFEIYCIITIQILYTYIHVDEPQ